MMKLRHVAPLWLIPLFCLTKPVLVCGTGTYCTGFFGCLLFELGQTFSRLTWVLEDLLVAVIGGPCSLLFDPCGPDGVCVPVRPGNPNDYNYKQVCQCSVSWGGRLCDEECDPGWYGDYCRHCLLGSNACGEGGKCACCSGSDGQFYPEPSKYATECECDRGWIQYASGPCIKED